MKVYELMAELAKAPSGAIVTFHTLTPKDENNIVNYLDDPNWYEVDFQELVLNYIDEGNVQLTTI
jgi:hypothetical protein